MTTPEQQAEELLPCEFKGTATVCTSSDPPICASCERRPAVAAIIAELRSQLAVATKEVETYKRLYDLRGHALRRGCPKCGYEQKEIVAQAERKGE